MPHVGAPLTERQLLSARAAWWAARAAASRARLRRRPCPPARGRPPQAGVPPVRRRVQQDTLGHRGRKGDPLLGIQTLLRAGAEKLTERQRARLERAIDVRPEHDAVFIAWSVAQRLRLAYRHPNPTQGRKIAEQLTASLPSCPIPEVARLGRTLRRWSAASLAYVATDRASNGGTEAINGLIELHRRIDRGLRNLDNYRLRMLLIGGGLTDPRL